jgi:hypothetical protein
MCGSGNATQGNESRQLESMPNEGIYGGINDVRGVGPGLGSSHHGRPG